MFSLISGRHVGNQDQPTAWALDTLNFGHPILGVASNSCANRPLTIISHWLAIGPIVR